MCGMSSAAPSKGENRRSARPVGVTLGLALICCALFGLTGCGGDVQTPDVTDTPTSQPSPTKVATTRSDPPGDVALATPTALPTLSLSPTSSATPTATPPPTPTATDTPTPTATPLPSARLSEGRRLQANGDFAEARRLFAALLRDAPGGAEAAEAKFRLAQCYLEDELESETVAALQAFLSEHPDDPRRHDALFLLGEAYYGQSEWDLSVAAYQSYLDESGRQLADVIYQRIGGAQRAAGRLGDAQEAYSAALRVSPDVATSQSLRRTLGEVQFLRGDYEGALAQYQALGALAETAAQRAEAALRQSETLRMLGRTGEVQERLWAAMAAEPRSAYAYEALRALLDMGVEVDDYLRGVIDYHNGAYWPAYNALQRYLDSKPEERAADAHNYIALIYSALELRELAIAEWDRLIVRYPESDLIADAWLGQAKALRADGETEQARDLLHRFATKHPEHAQAPVALALAAEWAERDGDYSTAAAEYAALGRSHPQASQAAPALFRAALNRYRLGQYAEAVQLWDTVLSDHVSYREQATRFWLGKARLATGEREAALEAWQALLDVAPEGYYGGRAVTLATEAGLELERRETGAPATASSQAAAEEWLRTWLPPAETALGMLPTTISDDAAYQRGLALWSLGLHTEAMAELERVRKSWVDDAQAMYAMALRFREMEAYRLSILCAARLLDLSPLERRSAAPVFLQELVYPTYFSDLVEAEAAAHGLDSALVYAITRQESLFDPVARSYAAAQGLMQLIPSTAEWVAERIGWRDFQAGHAFRPYINVKFGVAYLAYALGDSGGNVTSALVAYNAGPGNARRWRSLAGEDDDLFVEIMTNTQPQLYVRGVLEQHAAYARLYGAG
jgi:soluble lytic murein transglycosylase